MDFEEHEEPEEEMAMPPGGGGGGGGADSTTTIINTISRKPTAGTVRYRECLKNHAVGMGGHALDGCGEFMAAGDEGTLDALKCAACNCHRNFHRKETINGGGGGGVQGQPPPPYHHHHHHHHGHLHNQFSPQYYSRPPPPSGYLHLTPQSNRPLALPAAASGGGYSREEEDVSNPSSSGGGGGGSSKKRFRTKFTQEQKDKMLEFAEKLGWRLQRHDDVAVEQFCTETGVSRQVLKVWMHNNKHTLGKKP